MKTKTTFGVIVGNRGFFPKHLVKTGHEDMRRVLKAAGYGCVVLGFDDTEFGSVESRQDAERCARLFKEKASEIDGVIVTLPNFGDERAVANSLRWAGLDVPVLIHAEPDSNAQMTVADRRDSFCGKISVANNLKQYGIPFTLTTVHCESVKGAEFARDLASFAATCRVVKALRRARFGAIGARTGPFNTVRYSEKILERHGISVETVDLSEILAAAGKVAPADKEFKARLRAVKAYVSCAGVTAEGFQRMARFAVAIDRWVASNDIQGTAIQCWTAIEELYGIVPCAVMSMLSESGASSACEVDIGGAIAMHALRAASGTPSALVDWNNNYGADPNKCVVFHCSNLPKSVLSCPRMTYQAIIVNSVGEENAYGAVMGRVKAGPATFARVSTDDTAGTIRSYVGQGTFTEDPVETFGGYGVLEVPRMQELLRYICKEGFEHHTAVNLSQTGAAVAEAFRTYLGYEVYEHSIGLE
jgi:L-fucose isomerase-like protein